MGISRQRKVFCAALFHIRANLLSNRPVNVALCVVVVWVLFDGLDIRGTSEESIYFAGCVPGCVVYICFALRFGKSEDIMKLWDYLEKGIKHSSRSMAPIVNAEKAVMAISKEQVECAHTSPQQPTEPC